MRLNEQDFYSFIIIKEGLDKSSVRHCMVRIKIINEWFSDKDLTKENVEKFFYHLQSEKKLKNNSLNTYRFTFRHLVSYCKDRGMPYDFFDGFKSFKKTKADIIILTIEEIERIINTSLSYGNFRGRDCNFLDFRYRTLVEFLANTGCRFSEAANLTLQFLDVASGKVTFVDTKTDSNRTVYVFDPLRSHLKKLIENRKLEERVFRNATGTFVQASDFSEDLKSRSKVAGITKNVFPHLFRHSWATHMLEAGVPETQVAKLGGWKDVQVMYDTYMHLADRTLEKASMRNPLVRKYVDPMETIKMIREQLESFHLSEDHRLSYSISEDNNNLKFELSVK